VGQIKIQGVCNLKVVMQDGIKLPMNHKSKLLFVVEKMIWNWTKITTAQTPLHQKNYSAEIVFPSFVLFLFFCSSLFFSFATFEYHKITIYCRISWLGQKDYNTWHKLI
jgi:hypothetical protein